MSSKETQLGLDNVDAQAVIGMKKIHELLMAKSGPQSYTKSKAVEEEFEGLPIRTRPTNLQGALINEIILESAR